MLDEIKLRSVPAFEEKNKTILPTIQELAEATATNPHTVSGVVLGLLREGVVAHIQDGKLRRYAINYDAT